LYKLAREKVYQILLNKILNVRVFCANIFYEFHFAKEIN